MNGDALVPQLIFSGYEVPGTAPSFGNIWKDTIGGEDSTICLVEARMVCAAIIVNHMLTYNPPALQELDPCMEMETPGAKWIAICQRVKSYYQNKCLH